jgi:hypothetical protein
MSLGGPRRIHIAPQGYEDQRIYEPAIEHNADKVVLITHDTYTDRAEECKETIEVALEEAGIEYDDEPCDIFDLYDTLWKMADIIHEHDGDKIRLNVSTGSKITAISGMIACMATDAIPYYVKVEEYRGETITEGVSETVPLNAYPIGVPDQHFIEVLSFIDEHDAVSKKELIEFIRAREFSLLAGYNRDELKNMYRPLNREILDPLEDRGYIQIQRRGQSKQVWLTDDGEETLRVFQYLLD